MELPEEGPRVQAQVLAQLGGSEPAGRLEDQGDDGLRQMAMAGKADIAMEPKPLLIELGQLGQGIEAAIVIEAGQGAPHFEPPTDGAERALELFLEFGQGDDLLSPPAPEQRGDRVLDRCHGEGGIGMIGTLYDYCLKRHIVCQTLAARQGKSQRFH